MAQSVRIERVVNVQLQQSIRLMPMANSFEHHLGRSVSIDQAAAMLGVCRRTIYNRIQDGSRQTVRTLGTSQRVLVESIDEYRQAIGDEPARPAEYLGASNVVPFERRRVSC